MIPSDFHIGRSWAGTPIEDTCGCEQLPCGLVSMNNAGKCEQHAGKFGKTMRQIHSAEKCPGAKNDS